MPEYVDSWRQNLPGMDPRPVPTPSVDDYLSGAADYTAPRPTIPIPEPMPSLPTYSNWARVVDAYRQSLLSYDEAYTILMTQFGYSSVQAEAALENPTVESTEFPEESLVLPDPAPPAPVTEPAPEAGGAGMGFKPGGGYEVIGALAIFALAYWLSKQG